MQSCSFAYLNLLLFDVLVAVVVASVLYSVTQASLAVRVGDGMS